MSVRPSVTSQCSTQMAKCRIAQTTPHDCAGTLNGGAKCRSGRLNADVVAADWQFSTQSFVTLT